MIRPVAAKYFMSKQELAKERQFAHERALVNAAGGTVAASNGGSNPVAGALAWAVVLIPIMWGAWVTLQKTALLFK